ncbi:serine/threonine protein kinase [Mangrovactinospora gilvigrisea]|uniref:non-specific serine/threonine protein kinase n=1 Tax=Mangrovactinospora gilvigrisea TaxID=1428644 RepID=A0A1J7BG04_9ACTN|nr:serine/threonine-protein kinase [Mangrovactinospora gilvigrisea]OIV37582.1 serine/threonine protein kinase [Mangrovactinospora gilvigrisea]
MRPVGSKYLLEEVLGHGATGTVWRGQVRDSGDRVAIKVLKEELASDPDVVMRFLRERSVLLRLSHPNIVRTRDLVVEGTLLALVMDLVDAPDLHKYLRLKGRFSPVAGALVMAQIADALAASHADGVVHRDLKPANVLLEERPQPGADFGSGQVLMRPMLTDFGIARLADSPGVTRTSEFVGTPAYVAPESAEGRPQTSAVDIYGAGIVLYELVTGRPPFQGEGALAVLRQHLEADPPRPSGLPAPLWTVIERCLDKEPTRRPSAVSLGRALRVVADGIGVHAAPAAIAAAENVAALLLPDRAPAPAYAPGEHPAAQDDGSTPDALRTNVMPTGSAAPPGSEAPTRPAAALPPRPDAPPATRVMPSAGPGGPGQTQPVQQPQQPPQQPPQMPPAWGNQLEQARYRNEQTEVAGWAPQQPAPPARQRSQRPQRAPLPREAQRPGPPPERDRPRYEQPQRREPEPTRRREQPPRERRPRQKMRIPGLGCLKGCLFVVVVLVVVAILVWNFTPLPDWVAKGESWWQMVSGWFHTVSGWFSHTGSGTPSNG